MWMKLESWAADSIIRTPGSSGLPGMWPGTQNSSSRTSRQPTPWAKSSVQWATPLIWIISPRCGLIFLTASMSAIGWSKSALE